MQLTATNAIRRRQSSKTLGNFGKRWKSGDTVTVIYPLAKTPEGKLEPMVAGVFGHSINVKEIKLKRIFIPTNSVLDDNFKPVVPDTLYQLSKIAPLFLDGAKAADEQVIEANKRMSAAQKSAALDAIKEKYKDLSPVVGKLKMIISTECIVIPMINDTPNITEARLVTQDLSDDRLREIMSIVADPQFGITDDANFVEVKYTFGSTQDKKVDGKVSPKGITKAYSLENRFPDAWKSMASLIATLPTDADVIASRNSNYRTVSETAIIKALTEYCSLASASIDALSEDKDVVERIKSAKNIIKVLDIPLQNFDLGEEEDTTNADAGDSDKPDFSKVIDEDDLNNARKVAEDEGEMETEEHAIGGSTGYNLSDD